VNAKDATFGEIKKIGLFFGLKIPALLNVIKRLNLNLLYINTKAYITI